VSKSVPLGTAQRTSTSANGAGRRATFRSPIHRSGRGVVAARRPLASFEASFVGKQAVLTIWGELDLLTEHEFRTFLAAVIDGEPGSIELDLRQLNFMDASGVGVIAHGLERLRVRGRSLTIRSSSSMVFRVLQLTGFANLVSIGPRERANAIEPALS
jgi:anti-sigma B factor antagonist